MLLELSRDNFTCVLPLVKTLRYNAVFAYSVIHQIQPGKVFVDNRLNPTCSLIISGAGKYLVVGNADIEEFMNNLIGYLKNKQNHLSYYDLYTSTNDLLEKIKDKLVGQIVLLSRSSFTFNESKFKQLSISQDRIHEGFILKRMDSALFEKYRKEIDPMYASLWSSAEDFIERGFGYSTLIDDGFASVCNSFFMGGGYVEIDIVTIEKHRKKGLATYTCATFIEHCLENSLVPNWDCDVGNHLSIQLATKLGFEKKEDFPILWWHQNNDVITKYLKKFNYSNN